MILIEKWDSFCVETKRLGTEKMSHAKSEAEKIIQSGHSHSHKVKFLQKLPIFELSKPLGFQDYKKKTSFCILNIK